MTAQTKPLIVFIVNCSGSEIPSKTAEQLLRRCAGITGNMSFIRGSYEDLQSRLSDKQENNQVDYVLKPADKEVPEFAIESGVRIFAYQTPSAPSLCMDPAYAT